MEWDHFKYLLQSTLLGTTTDYFFNKPCSKICSQ